MTLPLIHVLEKQSPHKKRQILSTIKRHHKKEKKIAPIVQFVKDNGGLDYSREKMEEYRDKAISILEEYPESEAREGLKELVLFTTSRNQ